MSRPAIETDREADAYARGWNDGMEQEKARCAEARADLAARLADAVKAAWQAHVAAMQLEYETGVEMFDKDAIPDAMAAAVLAAIREEAER